MRQIQLFSIEKHGEVAWRHGMAVDSTQHYMVHVRFDISRPLGKQMCAWRRMPTTAATAPRLSL